MFLPSDVLKTLFPADLRSRIYLRYPGSGCCRSFWSSPSPQTGAALFLLYPFSVLHAQGAVPRCFRQLFRFFFFVCAASLFRHFARFRLRSVSSPVFHTFQLCSVSSPVFHTFQAARSVPAVVPPGQHHQPQQVQQRRRCCRNIGHCSRPKHSAASLCFVFR